MKVKEFTQEVEKAYNKYFPNSKVFVKLSTNLYRSISINCCIAGSQNEVYNNIWENDMLKLTFTVDTLQGEFNKSITEESELPNDLKLEVHRKNYLIKPASNYLVYDGRVLKFRKTKGDSKKIIATLDKYFKNLHNELQNDLKADLIHDNHRELLLKKIV